MSGTTYIKWHILHSTATEHRDRSAKCIIKDHKVVYDYEKTVPVRLVIDKNSKLQELWIEFEVVQEYAMAGKVERNVLGSLKLNLAEYVQAGDNEGGDGITRRYLMQESKINSTLKVGAAHVSLSKRNCHADPRNKISIYMKQIDGDKNYTAYVSPRQGLAGAGVTYMENAGLF